MPKQVTWPNGISLVFPDTWEMLQADENDDDPPATFFDTTLGEGPLQVSFGEYPADLQDLRGYVTERLTGVLRECQVKDAFIDFKEYDGLLSGYTEFDHDGRFYRVWLYVSPRRSVLITHLSSMDRKGTQDEIVDGIVGSLVWLE